MTSSARVQTIFLRPPKTCNRAVAEANHMYANIKSLKDLPKPFLDELQDFFVNYHNLEGNKYRLLGCKGSGTAMTLIKKAMKAS